MSILIGSEYRECICTTGGCKNKVLVAPWYVPYGDKCDACRVELKDEENRRDDCEKETV